MTDLKKRAVRTSWIGFFFTAVSGTLLHFAFEASGGNTLVGVAAPVNESVWEHLKLVWFPFLLFAVVSYFVYGRQLPAFVFGETAALFVSMAFLVAAHYTCVGGILGRTVPAVDIALFYITVALAYLLALSFVFRTGWPASESAAIAALTALVVFLILSIYFTFHPPMLPLFRDPLSVDYGIPELLIR